MSDPDQEGRAGAGGGEESPVTVLVVDDQASFRRAVGEVVAALDGFSLVGEAESGEQGLAAAEELSPHIVIMDKRMPGIGGVEACRLLVERAPGVVVVIVSVEEPNLTLIESCGAAAFVQKERLSRRFLREVWQSHGIRASAAD